MDYYSWQNLDTGEWQGLLRFDPVTWSYEYAGASGWEPGQPERVKMFLLPSANGPDVIARSLAEQLARRYGVAA
jgi:hypothetical protein